MFGRIVLISLLGLLGGGCRSRPEATQNEGSRLLIEMPASAFTLDAGSFDGEHWALWRTGALADTLDLGEVAAALSIEARGTPCGGAWPLVECTWNDVSLGRLRVDSEQWSWYTLRRQFGPGKGVLRIALLNDRFSVREDLNLYVRAVRLLGEIK